MKVAKLAEKFLIVLVNITLSLAKTKSCPFGKFKSGFIDDCIDCPQNPETNCKGVGFDATSCKDGCIKAEESQAAESTGNNLATIIGISCGVFALILIVAALVWFLSKRKKNPTKTSDTGENMPEEHEMEPMTRHADENVDNGQSAPSATPSVAPPLSVALPASAGLGDGIALDLNKENNEMLPSYDV